MKNLALLSLILWTTTIYALPMVDPGLFVISGVKTCGNGEGFCLLGSDCSLDQDFKDDKTGHCGGLKGAFTPSAHFVCCSDSRISNEIKIEYENIQITTEEDNVTTTELPSTYFLDDKVIENDCNKCNSTVMFFFENKPVCFGSHIGKGWILTSGSCAASIHFLNELYTASPMVVKSMFLDDRQTQASVKTIIVHEKYSGPSSSISLPQVDNLALIQLNTNDSMTDYCTACLSKPEQKFEGTKCNTILIVTDPNEDSKTCEGELETLQGEDKQDFLILNCDSPLQYPGVNVGRPLYCNGILAGIESRTGAGITVFTKLSLYENWIKKNMQDIPEQKFRTT